MMRFLVDINVVLDVLLNRQPHVEASSTLWAAIENKLAEGMLSAHAVTTIHYLIHRELGNAKAKRMIRAMLQVFGVAAVDRQVIESALESASADYEDAVSAAAARFAGCDGIVTRDPKGFRGCELPVFTPESVLALIGTPKS